LLLHKYIQDNIIGQQPCPCGDIKTHNYNMTELEKLLTEYREKSEEKKDYFFVFLFLVVILIFIYNFIVPEFIYSKISVVGVSMYPTLVGADQSDRDEKGNPLNPKDFVGILHTKKVNKGDIVVFKPLEDRPLFIKRVIATEGDTVSFVPFGAGYKLAINGIILNEPYINNGSMSKGGATVKVEKGQFYALGDNRNFSDDSRSLGVFELSTVYGVAKNIYQKKDLIKIGKFTLIEYYKKTERIINPYK